MPAGQHDLTIEQGASYVLELSVSAEGQPVDLSGYIGKAQMRRKHTDAEHAAEFLVVVTNPATDGKLSIGLTAEQTAVISAGTYVYDLEIDNSGEVIRLLQGRLRVTPQVTR